jgi:hypothetical protein
MRGSREDVIGFTGRDIRTWAASVALIIFAAAGTINLYDSDGHRVGSLRQEGSRLDLFDAESRRVGWGRCDAFGRCEVFDREGRRIGETPDGRVILFAPRRPQGGGETVRVK